MTSLPTQPGARTAYVIGHRNPDADSICSAIAYAAYKHARGETEWVAARCGNSNARIDTILSEFRQPPPLHVSDVSPRVRDLMVSEVVSVREDATCAEALDLLDRNDIRLVPVIDPRKRVVGTISLSHLGGIFIPRASEPRLMRQVEGSLEAIARALKARVLHMEDGARPERLFVRVGSMDIRSFWSVSERENIPASQSIIIVGDRRDVQQRAIEIGVRGIVVTSNLPVDDAIVGQARARGVCLLTSPYDTATTAWVVRTASSIGRVVERKVASVHPDARIAEVRRKAATLGAPAWVVIDEDGALCGVLSKSDILKPAPTRLILVDHNEASQAVPGVEEVEILEILDHHRLGPSATPQPILFINEPVGSTCTIVADLFRRDGLRPSPEVAGLMMSGLVADTLNLNSPTTTPKDASTLAWLSEIAQVDPRRLSETIFASGSVIEAQPPEAVIRSDHKVYDESGVRFAVSQVEEVGFGNFWIHAKALARALEAQRKTEGLSFAALLITDVNTQNSLLLVKGDADLIRRISYAHVEENEIFDLPGIVSRKKQLIPYLTSLLRQMRTAM